MEDRGEGVGLVYILWGLIILAALRCGCLMKRMSDILYCSICTRGPTATQWGQELPWPMLPFSGNKWQHPNQRQSLDGSPCVTRQWPPSIIFWLVRGPSYLACVRTRKQRILLYLRWRVGRGLHSINIWGHISSGYDCEMLSGCKPPTTNQPKKESKMMSAHLSTFWQYTLMATL